MVLPIADIFAQNQRTDSLTSLVQALSVRLEHTQKELELVRGTEKQELQSRERQQYDSIAALKWNLGSVLMRESKLNEAIRLFKESSEINLELNNWESLSRDYYSLGRAFKKIAEYDSAYDYLQRTLTLAEKHNLKTRLGDTYNVLGNMAQDRSQHIQSLEYFQQSLKIAEEINDLELKSILLSNIAINHDNLEDLEQAEYYYLASIAIDKQLENGFGHYAQFNLGTLYLDQERYNEAKKLLLEVWHFRKLNGLKSYELTAVVRLARLYHRIDQKDSSRYFMEYGESLMSEISDYQSLASALEVLGLLHLNLNDSLKAEEQLLKAYDLHKKLEWDKRSTDVAYGLYEIFLAKKEYKKALQYLSEYVESEKEYLNTDKVRALTKLEAEYQHEQEMIVKQNEIQLLAAREQNANLKFTIVLIALFALAFFAFLISRYLILKKERKKKKLEEVAQFKEAMTGMIAHDLKNPLGVILGTESEQPTTRNMARQMLRLVENMLDVHKFEKAEMKLKMEPFSMGDLINETTRQVVTLLEEKNIQINQEIDPRPTVLGDREILLRVMINLMTNAIKYSPMNGVITIGVRSKEQQSEIFVGDQGRGIPVEKLNQIFQSYQQLDPRNSGFAGSTGLGLTFCKLAIEAHNAEIHVDSKMGVGTTFSFSLIATDAEMNESEEANRTYVLTIPEEDRALIIKLIPTLRSYKLHQAMQMEDLLKPVRVNSRASQEWVDAVLNAAYLGNRDHFEELVVEIEQSSSIRTAQSSD